VIKPKTATNYWEVFTSLLLPLGSGLISREYCVRSDISFLLTASLSSHISFHVFSSFFNSLNITERLAVYII